MGARAPPCFVELAAYNRHRDLSLGCETVPAVVRTQELDDAVTMLGDARWLG